MKIADILDTKGRTVHTILPWASVADGVRRLEQLDVGALVVCDADHRVAGIVSERDLIRELAQRGPALLDLRIDEVMTRKVATASLDEPLANAMARMTRGRYRHLPVLAGGTLVGMVSIGDLVKARLRDMELQTGVLRDMFIAAH
ncbi:CBS domain-containing protein [Pseudonocardia pini]|uniref:CBS domain-containing protein n=1 Tax=Pseudonocardia pini TaxID=2758030 RepID=UPI0015F0F3E9|nr:CBS domain-containing protein [Pseudonocardia pini]